MSNRTFYWERLIYVNANKPVIGRESYMYICMYNTCIVLVPVFPPEFPLMLNIEMEEKTAFATRMAQLSHFAQT